MECKHCLFWNLVATQTHILDMCSNYWDSSIESLESKLRSIFRRVWCKKWSECQDSHENSPGGTKILTDCDKKWPPTHILHTFWLVLQLPDHFLIEIYLKIIDRYYSFLMAKCQMSTIFLNRRSRGHTVFFCSRLMSNYV